jgi:hypothetical protein
VLHPVTGALAVFLLANISFDESESARRLGSDQGANLVEIMGMTGRERIQTDYILSSTQKGFDQMGADETCGTCHQPTAGLGFNFLQKLAIA